MDSKLLGKTVRLLECWWQNYNADEFEPATGIVEEIKGIWPDGPARYFVRLIQQNGTLSIPYGRFKYRSTLTDEYLECQREDFEVVTDEPG